jgi:hypothetical protein
LKKQKLMSILLKRLLIFAALASVAATAQKAFENKQEQNRLEQIKQESIKQAKRGKELEAFKQKREEERSLAICQSFTEGKLRSVIVANVWQYLRLEVSKVDSSAPFNPETDPYTLADLKVQQAIDKHCPQFKQAK